MSAKQEAKRLINKFTFASIYFADGDRGALMNAKFCSVQCIDEIIKMCPYMSKKDCETVEQLRANDSQFVSYWEEVKQEIKNNQKSKMKKNYMKNKILNWAEPKGLLKKENRLIQFAKLSEEVGELANAIIKDNKENQKDAIGDIYIVLTILANQLELDIDDCINSAYIEIKDRTGKNINGSFIKDE